MPTWIRTFLIAGCLTIAWPMTTAHAQEDVAALVQQLDELDAQLETDAIDCTTACDALRSMERAADKICELEPGDRCTSAKKRVEDARKRVQSACPECEAASGRKDDKSKTTTKDQNAQKKERDRGEPAGGDAEPVSEADVMQREEAGGCASCTVGDTRGATPATVAAWLLALAALASRRRRR